MCVGGYFKSRKGAGMMVEREKALPCLAVYLVLEDQDTYLLSLRSNTGWSDGNYSLVSGHVDAGETVVNAVAREAQEEIGIAVDTTKVSLCHVMYRKSNVPYVDFYFRVGSWSGTIINKESHKHGDVRFFPKASLPENLLPYIHQAFSCIEKGITFSEFGW